MGRQAKPVSSIDNNTYRKTREELDIREKIETALAAQSRDLQCPEYLTNEAKKEWARIVAIDNSRAKPIIYDSDIAMLLVLCELWAAWKISQAEWAKKQVTVFMSRDRKDVPKVIFNPYVAEMRRISKEMKPLIRTYNPDTNTYNGPMVWVTISTNGEIRFEFGGGQRIFHLALYFAYEITKLGYDYGYSNYAFINKTN